MVGQQRRRWHVEVLTPVADWLDSVSRSDLSAYEVVTAPINLLEEEGPALGRPMADRITGSKYQNLKELRAQTIRISCIFDPLRQAVLLVGGDKRD